MNKSIEKDINQEYIEAVKLYEEELSSSDTFSLETGINLAFLYWRFAADFGFVAHFNIPDHWRELGGKRYPEILNELLEKYPDNVELRFLKRYFPNRHLYDDFTQEECEQIIKEYGGGESLVPYFFLYLFDEEKYREQRDLLLEQCKKLPTAKNLYIKSIIE